MGRKRSVDFSVENTVRGPTERRAVAPPNLISKPDFYHSIPSHLITSDCPHLTHHV